MSIYFEAKRDDGSVLIEDKVGRLCLQRYGTLFNMSSSISGFTYVYHTSGYKDRRCVTSWHCTIPVSGDEFLIGYKFLNSDFNTCITCNRKSEKEISVSIYSTSSGLYPGSDDDSAINLAQSVIIYTFGEKVNTTSRTGLEIFNENGEKIFNSNEKFLQISSKYEYKYAFWSTDQSSLPLSFTIGENAQKTIIIPNHFLSSLATDSRMGLTPVPAFYGLSVSNNIIYNRLMTIPFFDGCWNYGVNGIHNDTASYLFADATYLS